MSKNVGKTTIYLFTLKIVGLLLSMATLGLTAKFFGISEARDIWLLITALLTSTLALLFGPLNETFRAKFTSLKESETIQKVEIRIRSLLGFYLVISCVALCFFYIYPSFFKEIIAPGIENQEAFVAFLYVMAPSILITQTSNLYIGILNAHDIFYIPEIMASISTALNFGLVYFLANHIGIYSLIISQYISLLILLSILIYFLSKKNIKVTPILIFKWDNIKPFIIYSLPFFLPYIIGQLSNIVEKNLSNTLGEGIVSSLDYSKKFMSILQSILASVLASLMVTDLTKYFVNKNTDMFEQNLKKYTQFLLIILCFGVSFLVGASSPISNFFFLKGEMTPADINFIARLMILYGFSFIGVSLYVFSGVLLLAQNKGKFYAIIGMCTQLGLIILYVSFYKSLGAYIFPIALGSTHLLASCFLLNHAQFSNKKKYGLRIVLVVLFILLVSSLLHYQSYLLLNYPSWISICIEGISLTILVGIASPIIIGIKPYDIIKIWIRKI